jgi:rhamnosyltransferase
MKIAAVLVLYNPKKIEDVISNISSFSDNVDYLIVIDNSEIFSFNENIFNENFDRVHYKCFGENIGIASALNEGCKLAIDFGCTHVLTMDQDSYFLPNHFKKLLQSVCLNDENCAIISPFHSVNEEIPIKNEIHKVEMCMTSGNILSLTAFQKVNGFLDKLFIDYVDYEFCGRILENNYLIYENSNSILNHQLGSLSLVKFFSKKINITNHSSVRRYYRARNFFYFFKKNIIRNPKMTITMFKQEGIDFILMILFEKNKFIKIKCTLLGVFDFFIARYGKISYKI